ncbi:hypothetical protein SK128_028054 [Halocaridina rubra]|uniref:G-protein coupled receptors family 1 profile domain-containing protein n=1 Tax=Halocaridina rubra TaxID=373956 RepID=A0AAN9AA25_HALRR
MRGEETLSRIILCIYFTSSICTLTECLFAIYITVKNVSLRKKPSKYFSYSLVASVGLLSAISLVYGAILISTKSVHHTTVSGCFVKVIQRWLSIVSCMTLSCLALDRYVFICWPLHYFSFITEVKCVILSTLCWVLGLTLLLLPLGSQLKSLCSDGKTNFTFLASYAVTYNVGAISMFVFYILVSREFRHHSKTNNTDSKQAETDALVRLKTARSALRVLLLYSLLSLPHMILPIILRFGWHVPRWLYHSCHLLHRLHLLLFLPMYVWANADSHEALKDSFRNMWQKMTCCKKSTDANRRKNRCCQGATDVCCDIVSFLYNFFCCPSNDKPRLRLEEEFSQESALTHDTSESRV